MAVAQGMWDMVGKAKLCEQHNGLAPNNYQTLFSENAVKILAKPILKY
jgi:hypothetical protein